MSQWVVDASVIVKWIFPQRPAEGHGEPALALLQAIRRAEITVVQPPHWLAEVAAVVARLDAAIAAEAIPLLYAMEFPIADDLETYQRATALAAELKQHVFDTLYHAVALVRHDTMLVTADERYFRKARRFGHVVRLSELTLPGVV